MATGQQNFIDFLAHDRNVQGFFHVQSAFPGDSVEKVRLIGEKDQILRNRELISQYGRIVVKKDHCMIHTSQEIANALIPLCANNKIRLRIYNPKREISFEIEENKLFTVRKDDFSAVTIRSGDQIFMAYRQTGNLSTMERTWKFYTLSTDGEILNIEETEIDVYNLVIAKLRTMAGLGPRIQKKEQKQEKPKQYHNSLFAALNA